MVRVRRIAIVGAGLSGLATALAAAGAGMQVALLDESLKRGVQLHWGTPVERCDADAGKARLYRPRGLGWEGDLVVIAGAPRVAGAELPSGAPHHRLPQRWDHVLIPRPRRIDRCTRFVGPKSHNVVVVPTGVAEAGLAVLRNEPAGEAPAPASAAGLRERLVQVGGVPSSLAPLVRDGDVVIGRPVQTGLLDGAWHRGAAPLVGASAPILPPHFGQGAAQSVEDAAVLGRLLRADLERSHLLTPFNAHRGERAGRVHAITTQAALWDLCPEPTIDLPAWAQRLAPIVELAA